MPLTDRLKELLKRARAPFEEAELDLTGLHYYQSAPDETFQRRRKGLAVCFDTTTHNPYFFGQNYSNKLRIMMLGLAYSIGFEFLSQELPDHEILLDTYVRLMPPFKPSVPACVKEDLKSKYNLVDVTAQNDVHFMSVQESLEKGEIENGSTIDQYARKYGVKNILIQGRHIISPDSSTVEALETICEQKEVRSVLEIGSGVGICGIAAQRHGIKDYVFVDSNPDVCSYLKDNFPSYQVRTENALDLDLNRYFDVVLVGLPYELLPDFMAKQGKSLAERCELAVFQSGTMAFFQQEHDWLTSRQPACRWPCWNASQSLIPYFSHFIDSRLDWQTCIVAGHTKKEFNQIAKAMFCEKKFKHILYEYLLLFE